MSDQEQRPLDSMGVPREPIDRIVKPITRFLHVETAGGFVLLGCTVIALALANSAWSEQYLAIWKTQVGFSIGSFEGSKRRFVGGRDLPHRLFRVRLVVGSVIHRVSRG